MRVCLKCQAFYDDDNVKFCLNDGVPLLNMDQTHGLWEKGAEAVRQTRKTVSKQIRKQKLTRIVSTTVTTVLTVMVVSVMALNSYVYLNPEREEVAQDTQPGPSPTPVELARLQPAGEETPTPTPDATPTPTWTDMIWGTPTPTPTPIPTPTPPPTPTPTPPPTPTPTPPPTPTPTPIPPTPTPPVDTPQEAPVCNQLSKNTINTYLARWKSASWKNEISKNEELMIKKKYVSEFTYLSYPIPLEDVRASITSFSLSIFSGDDCASASVRINYVWSAFGVGRNDNKEGKKYGGSKSGRCTFNGITWDCRYR